MINESVTKVFVEQPAPATLGLLKTFLGNFRYICGMVGGKSDVEEATFWMA